MAQPPQPQGLGQLPPQGFLMLHFPGQQQGVLVPNHQLQVLAGVPAQGMPAAAQGVPQIAAVAVPGVGVAPAGNNIAVPPNQLQPVPALGGINPFPQQQLGFQLHFPHQQQPHGGPAEAAPGAQGGKYKKNKKTRSKKHKSSHRKNRRNTRRSH